MFKKADFLERLGLSAIDLAVMESCEKRTFPREAMRVASVAEVTTFNRVRILGQGRTR